MKKNYLFSAIALCVCLLTACNKEIDTPQTESSEENKEGVITYIRATGNENASKGSIDGTSGNFSWNVDDQIAVWDKTAGGYNVSDGLTIDDFSGDNATFSFTDLGDRSNYAVSPAWIRVAGNPTWVNLPGTYDLTDIEDAKSPVPMIAVNNEGTLHFKQLGALLRITLNNLPPSTRSVTINFNGKKVQGTFVVSDPDSDTPSIATEAASDGNDVITINTGDLGGWTDGKDVNIPVPTGTYTTITVKSWTDADGGGTNILTMTMPIKPGLNTTWKPIRTSARKMTASLPAFSVSDDLRVSIAKSNLKCYTTDAWKTWSWSFMTNPWDIVETSNLSYADYAGATEIGLFGWGTSGHAAFKDDPHYGVNWKPYHTDTENEKYGPINKVIVEEVTTYQHYADLTGEPYKYGDWGVEIGVGRDQAIDGYKTWRTLTSNELVYLVGLKNSGTGNTPGDQATFLATFVTEDTKDNHSFSRRKNNWGIGKIGDMYGLIVVPDHFVDPSGKFTYGYMSNNSGKIYIVSNLYSIEEWVPMSDAGAVFLPYAGKRSGTGVDLESAGCYWASDRRTNAGLDFLASYQLRFSGGNNLRVISEYRNSGRAVRLVRDLN